ncbi:MAG: hypothetical protein WBB22_08380 [Anaerolineae bacterium]
MTAGTPQEIESYVKQLIEDVAQDGSFILNTGVVVDDLPRESAYLD